MRIPYAYVQTISFILSGISDLVTVPNIQAVGLPSNSLVSCIKVIVVICDYFPIIGRH